MKFLLKIHHLVNHFKCRRLKDDEEEDEDFEDNLLTLCCCCCFFCTEVLALVLPCCPYCPVFPCCPYCPWFPLYPRTYPTRIPPYTCIPHTRQYPPVTPCCWECPSFSLLSSSFYCDFFWRRKNLFEINKKNSFFHSHSKEQKEKQ